MVVAVEVVGPDGRGRMARSRVVPVEADEPGDDLDEVADRGDGPFQGGEGVEVAIVPNGRKVSGGWGSVTDMTQG